MTTIYLQIFAEDCILGTMMTENVKWGIQFTEREILIKNK